MTARSLQQEAVSTIQSWYPSGTGHAPAFSTPTESGRQLPLPGLYRAPNASASSHSQPSAHELVEARPPVEYPPGRLPGPSALQQTVSHHQPSSIGDRGQPRFRANSQESLPVPPRAASDAYPHPASAFLASATSHAPLFMEPPLAQNQIGKAHRAQLACDPCRARKAKCDEVRPVCGLCKEKHLACVYRDEPPHNLDKGARQMMDRMQRVEDRLGEALSDVQRSQVTHGLMLSQLASDLLREQNDHVPKELPKQTPQYLSGVFDKGGELSIPVNHTTAAHKLLLWPSINKLLRPTEYDVDYVMRLENKRGLIHVYGRGEGDDSEDPMVSAVSTNPSAAVAELYPSGPWGGFDQPQSKLADVGLDDTGRVTTNPDTIRRYHGSYMDHLHKLHPFLDQNDLGKNIEWFIRIYCPSARAEMPRDAKRKLSCDTVPGTGCGMGSPVQAGSNIIERSIGNAIVLLVLALGSICEVRDRPVPGPIMDYVVGPREEQVPGPSSSSMLPPAESDKVVVSQSNSLRSNPRSFNSPGTGDGRRSTTGHPHPNDRNLRNLDVVPGLAFYAYATSILGNLQGGNGLYHVQAALLAGLYAGQLAYPLQSHGWINQAGRACQVLVRSYGLPATYLLRRGLTYLSTWYKEIQDSPVKDLYNFAYWTCLQLESDILAELDLPASGISRFEEHIALPKGHFILSLPSEIAEPSTTMMFFYSAQVHLRKVLNRVHTDLYKVEKRGQTSPTMRGKMVKILRTSLEQWRSNLPKILTWEDSDRPSKDINVARMRAKYYGARYLIHRPYLYYALHRMGQSNAPAGPGQWTYRELPAELRSACRICIESAIKSTESFDGIEGRLIVTNIFGTAHAQFGNMLVLSATYKSHLSELIDRNDLDRLLRRTINFLLQNGYTSSALRNDADILSRIHTSLFK